MRHRSVIPSGLSIFSKYFSYPTKADRIRRRAARTYALLILGMADEECLFLTLTKHRDVALELRAAAWHYVHTRLRQKWPEVQALTVFEWNEERGSHLHIVMKRVPSLTPQWLMHTVSLLGDGTKCQATSVYERSGLAAYLTKQLRDEDSSSAWPRYFRPVTMTKGWLPPRSNSEEL